MQKINETSYYQDSRGTNNTLYIKSAFLFSSAMDDFETLFSFFCFSECRLNLDVILYGPSGQSCDKFLGFL
jgi:hypothetical protein